MNRGFQPGRRCRGLCLLGAVVIGSAAVAAETAPEGGRDRLERSVLSPRTVSAATRYRLQGTAGQAEAAASSAARYRLQGGFWPTPAGSISAELRLFGDGFEQR